MMKLTLSELISKLPRSQEGTSQHQHNNIITQANLTMNTRYKMVYQEQESNNKNYLEE